MRLAHTQCSAVIAVPRQNGQVAVMVLQTTRAPPDPHREVRPACHRQRKCRHVFPLLRLLLRTPRRWCLQTGSSSRADHRTRRQDHPEAAQGLLQRHILPCIPVNCSATEKLWDRKRCTLRARLTVQLILFGQLVHTHDGDDILQLLVSLQHLLYGTRYLIVLLAYDFRCQDTAGESSGSTAG